jgi:hypothetical protein
MILQARVPAEAFSDWIFDEVFPQVRQKGYYGSSSEPLLSLQNELDLHKAVVVYLRQHYPDLLIAPGLGELQRTPEMRKEAWCKGYSGGQPDLLIPMRSGRYAGFALELKTPRGTGQLSHKQTFWLAQLDKFGWKTLVSNNLLEIIGELERYLRRRYNAIGQTSGSSLLAVSSRTTMSGTSTVRPDDAPEK